MAKITNPKVLARIEAEKAAVERLRRVADTSTSRVQINTTDLKAAIRLIDLYDRQATTGARSTEVLRALDTAIRTGDQQSLDDAMLSASAHLASNP